MTSKFSWAKEGAVNSKLFHRLMNTPKSKNCITKLGLEDESIVDKEGDIVSVVTKFYQSLISWSI